MCPRIAARLTQLIRSWRVGPRRTGLDFRMALRGQRRGRVCRRLSFSISERVARTISVSGKGAKAAGGCKYATSHFSKARCRSVDRSPARTRAYRSPARSYCPGRLINGAGASGPRSRVGSTFKAVSWSGPALSPAKIKRAAEAALSVVCVGWPDLRSPCRPCRRRPASPGPQIPSSACRRSSPRW